MEKLKAGKSPGPDGMPAEVVKEVMKAEPKCLRALMNSLFGKGRFPKRWKVAKVVFLWKGKWPMELASSHRPIYLLDAIGKLFEGLIRDRLEKEWEARGGLSPRQYGFRKGRSTVHAIEYIQEWVLRFNYKLKVMVTLDVKNAFNSVSWFWILKELQTRNISRYLLNVIKSYLSDRRILVGREELEMTRGVLRGSVLGPTLWNIVYDGVLGLGMGPGIQLIGFAYDIAILASTDDAKILSRVNATN